jgi:hypothetical protein
MPEQRKYTAGEARRSMEMPEKSGYSSDHALENHDAR